MAELKTKQTDASVEDFLQSVADAFRILKLMKEVTRAKPRMWGTSIVGFGSYHYKYPSGCEGDWFVAGFSPRKGNLTLYLMSGFAGHAELLKKLGKHKTGKSCLYIKRLDDVDVAALRELVRASVAQVSKAAKA